MNDNYIEKIQLCSYKFKAKIYICIYIDILHFMYVDSIYILIQAI